MTYSMPETAEEVGRVDGISREDADAFAVRSHERSLAAIAAGRFADEIVPVTVKTRKGETVVDTDEGPRAGTTMDVLAGLRPVVKGGSVVTAGNSSTLNDGASAIIVASEAAIQKLGLTPRARIIDGASAGCEPEIMGIGPVPATQKVLDRTGLSVGDLGAVELNEAFATQSLASMRRLGLDPDIVNNDGGAIALGHPLGSSGSRIAITLLGRMEREDAQDRPRHHVHRRRPGHRHAAGARLMAAPDSANGHLSTRDFSTLLVEEREDRVVVLLNRPEVRNAIDQQMVDELHAVCAALEQNPKVLIIAGVDGVFASGADIAQLRERRRDDALQGINSTIFVRIAKLPMPVIAALDGYCLGGGAELAYAADFRIGTPERPDRQPGNRPGHPRRGRCQLAAEGTGGGAGGQGDPAGRAACCAPNEALAVNLITEIHEAPVLMDGSPQPRRPHRPAGPAGRADHQVRVPRPGRGAPADRPAGAGHPLRIPGQVRPHAGVPGQEDQTRKPVQQNSDSRQHRQDPAMTATSRDLPASSESSAAAAWAPASPTPS